MLDIEHVLVGQFMRAAVQRIGVFPRRVVALHDGYNRVTRHGLLIDRYGGIVPLGSGNRHKHMVVQNQRVGEWGGVGTAGGIDTIYFVVVAPRGEGVGEGVGHLLVIVVMRVALVSSS